MWDESAPEKKFIPFQSSSTQLGTRNMQPSTQKRMGSAQIAFLPKAKEKPLHCGVSTTSSLRHILGVSVGTTNAVLGTTHSASLFCWELPPLADSTPLPSEI